MFLLLAVCRSTENRPPFCGKDHSQNEPAGNRLIWHPPVLDVMSMKQTSWSGCKKSSEWWYWTMSDTQLWFETTNSHNHQIQMVSKTSGMKALTNYMTLNHLWGNIRRFMHGLMGQSGPYMLPYWLLMAYNYTCFPTQGGISSWMYWMSVPTDNQSHSLKLCALYVPVPAFLYCKHHAAAFY